jgi:RNA polymerase-binding protein DksA
MNKADSKQYKERLLAMRDRLRGDVGQMTNAVLAEPPMFANGASAAMPIHMADIATDNFDREFTLSLMESTDQTLDQIEEALERIEDGVYGVCRACEGKIPKVRLNAIPYTVLCVSCAARHELD